jgi:predicted Fe-S protein YdhL (DUF1289 family)
MNTFVMADSAIKIIAAYASLTGAAADKVPSPCISVCRMSPRTSLCEGCFRTVDEIRQWSKSDDAAKLALWCHVEQRAQASLV